MHQELSWEAVAALVTPRRRIHGAAAVLLPHRPDGTPDVEAFAELVRFIADCGLTPAVNMDTGYGELLAPTRRRDLLRTAADALRGRAFVAGVYADEAPDPADAYRRGADEVRALGGVPILFPCGKLKAMEPAEQRRVFRRVAAGGGPLLAFELNPVFTAAGFLFSEELYLEILELPAFCGMKHSSLDRRAEWERLSVRNRVRPDFRIYTGNDLAIDMVIYGSDYLLGLATFAPDAFALRDVLWEKGDPSFFELNDVLQYLGQFAFRPPVAAYKHSAAQFLRLRGRIPWDAPHPRALRRPDTDLPVLQEIARRLHSLMQSIQGAPLRSRTSADPKSSGPGPTFPWRRGGRDPPRPGRLPANAQRVQPYPGRCGAHVPQRNARGGCGSSGAGVPHRHSPHGGTAGAGRSAPAGQPAHLLVGQPGAA